MLDAIDLIAGQLRDAALDPSGWTTALDSINAFVGGAGAVILSVEERLRHAPHSTDLGELMEDYFSNGWYAHDRRDRCVPLIRETGIALDHQVLEVDEKDPYYAEFLTRHDRRWFAGLGANLDGDLWCLALQRSPGQGAFLATDMSRLVAVRTRLEDAASLSRIVGRSWLDGAITALDGEGAAALVLSRAGRILEMNEAAQSIVCGPQGRNSCKLFEDMLLAKLVEVRRSGRRPPRMAFEFEQKHYALEVTVLRDKVSLLFSKASLLVRIYPQASDAEATLRGKFRFTRSEARVAMALASGMSVEAMAEAFGVSPNTIRAQLKVAYAKTETGNQAKLVALVAQLGRP